MRDLNFFFSFSVWSATTRSYEAEKRNHHHHQCHLKVKNKRSLSDFFPNETNAMSKCDERIQPQ